jgi:hypothetical protein
MPKYIIDGNVNFYEELYKSLDEPDIKEEISSFGTCLITNNPLIENHVKLDCNHTFNYDAIFNDIKCHKNKYNSMERVALKNQEIRCPYCRTIQKRLLPHIDGYEKIHGVNYYDETIDFIYNHHQVTDNEYCKGKCCYISESQTNCTAVYVKIIEIEGKKYCGPHYRATLRKIYYANKVKERMEKKNALLLEKQKLKEEKIKIKAEEALKKKEARLKLKNENVIIKKSKEPTVMQSLEIDTSKCVQILKSGKNKGSPCGCKILKDGFCLRHYKMQNKGVEETVEK